MIEVVVKTDDDWLTERIPESIKHTVLPSIAECLEILGVDR